MRKQTNRTRRKDNPFVALAFLLLVGLVSFYQRNPLLVSGLSGVIAVLLVLGLLWIRQRRAIHNTNLALARDLYQESATGFEFEYRVADIFRMQGFRARVTPASGDKGIDIFLERDGEQAAVQCKRYSGQVGPGEIREFIGALDSARVKTGYFVTTGQFSKHAEEAAQNGSCTIYLFDGNKLGQWQQKLKGKGEVMYTAFLPFQWWLGLSQGQRVMVLAVMGLVIWGLVSFGIYWVGNQNLLYLSRGTFLA